MKTRHQASSSNTCVGWGEKKLVLCGQLPWRGPAACPELGLKRGARRSLSWAVSTASLLVGNDIKIKLRGVKKKKKKRLLILERSQNTKLLNSSYRKRKKMYFSRSFDDSSFSWFSARSALRALTWRLRETLVQVGISIFKYGFYFLV